MEMETMNNKFQARLEEQKRLIQARLDGRKFQMKGIDEGDNAWHDAEPMIFSFGIFDYRIKPTPREWIIDTQGRLPGRHHESGRAAFPVGPPLHLIAVPPYWIKV